jgi:hypothetical protein
MQLVALYSILNDLSVAIGISLVLCELQIGQLRMHNLVILCGIGRELGCLQQIIYYIKSGHFYYIPESL